MKTLLSFGVVALILLIAQSQPVLAQCQDLGIQIPASYVNGTGRCAFVGAIRADTQECAVGGTNVARFFNVANNRQVPNQGWQTWSSPPFSEQANPRVLFQSQPPTVMTIWLRFPGPTAGLEVEGNAFVDAQFMVEFWNDSGTRLGVITRTVQGRAGARLFAATCGQPIHHIRVIAAPNAQGFAVAQLRSSGFPRSDEEEDLTDQMFSQHIVPDEATSNADPIIIE